MKDPRVQRFIDRTRALRNQRRMSAAALADLLGCKREVVANLENGRRQMLDLAEALRICEIFDVDLIAMLSPEPLTISVATVTI